MLKRNGELLRNEVPGYGARLTDSELASCVTPKRTVGQQFY